MKTIILILISIVAVSTITIVSISAEESLIPAWIKNTASFWVKGDISDKEFISAIEWMLENNVLRVSSTGGDEYTQNQLELYKSSYKELKKENEQLKKDVSRLQSDVNALMRADSNYYQEPSVQQKQTQPEFDPSQYCYGKASCFVGTVTEIIDGDTIKVDGKSIRFALVDAPEKKHPGYDDARNFISEICPVGSTVLVDEDDQQTSGSYGRMLALVYCHDTVLILNEAVLVYGHGWIMMEFCNTSEFATQAWALAYGCGKSSYSAPSNPTPKYSPPSSSQTTQQSCDPSYPTVCIPPYPPDLDCSDIPYKKFKVLQPDPHRFDGDKDGIGCES